MHGTKSIAAEMNPLLSKIFNSKNSFVDDANIKQSVTSFQLAKAFIRFRISVVRLIKDGILISAGICSAAFGLEGFLLPSNFIDGGAPV